MEKEGKRVSNAPNDGEHGADNSPAALCLRAAPTPVRAPLCHDFFFCLSLLSDHF